MPTNRIAKVNELLRRALSELIARDIEFPPGVFVTISHVETSRDLEHAKIFVTILPDHKRVTGMKTLAQRLPHLQHILGKKVKMRQTPKLHLAFDRGQIYAQHLYDVINKLHNDSNNY